jgi:hypothetical protein
VDDHVVPRDAPPPVDSQHAGLVRLLVLAVIGGALAGLLGGVFGWVLVESLKASDLSPEAIAIVGMSALFAAGIRAPITGAFSALR